MDRQHVYSTGQTADDFANILKLMKLWHPDRDVSTLFPAAPTVMDPEYIPSDRGAMLITLTILTVLIATIALLLRFYDRLHLQKLNKGKPLLDDYSLAVALLLTWVLTALSCYGATTLQWGYHAIDLRFWSISQSLKIQYAIQYLSLYQLTLIRLSLLFFFRRLYHQTSSRCIVFCNAIAILSVLVAVVLTTSFVFQCMPPSAAYDVFRRAELHCRSTTLSLASAISQVTLDGLVIAAPLRLIFVKTVKHRRGELILLLFIGLTAWCCGFARFLFLRLGGFDDFTWKANSNAVLCAQFEATVGITVACAPGIRNVILRWKARGCADSNIEAGWIMDDVPSSSRKHSDASQHPVDIVYPCDTLNSMNYLGIGGGIGAPILVEVDKVNRIGIIVEPAESESSGTPSPIKEASESPGATDASNRSSRRYSHELEIPRPSAPSTAYSPGTSFESLHSQVSNPPFRGLGAPVRQSLQLPSSSTLAAHLPPLPRASMAALNLSFDKFERL